MIFFSSRVVATRMSLMTGMQVQVQWATDRTIMLRMDLAENQRVGGQGTTVCIYALKHDVMSFLDDKLNGTGMIFSCYQQGSQRHDLQFLATRISSLCA
jgi:hypothetical protein